MEALEFSKEYNRMCVVNKGCQGCPLKGDTCCSLSAELSEEQITIIVDKTEQWSKEHPIITNARKFKEIFGLPAHCMIDQDAQWWDEPYKEP
jgi:hypothetical protein